MPELFRDGTALLPGAAPLIKGIAHCPQAVMALCGKFGGHRLLSFRFNESADHTPYRPGFHATLPKGHVCFLVETLQDSVDCLVDMNDKLITRIYNHARNDVDDHNKAQRKRIRESLTSFKTLAEFLLDESVEDSALHQVSFEKIKKEDLLSLIEEVNTWLNGKYSHVFNLVKDRFTYLRQFSPAFLKHIGLQSEGGSENSSLLEAI